jgi:hypothetical protein
MQELHDGRALTRRYRLKQMRTMARCKGEMLRGFGVQSKVIQAKLPNRLCRGLCVASQTVATPPDVVVGMSDDSC